MKENVATARKLSRGREEAGSRSRAPAGTGTDERAGEGEREEEFSGWKQLASSFFRLYGRYPASAQGGRGGRDERVGGDGNRYPERVCLQERVLRGGAERAFPSRRTVGYGAWYDSVPLPRIQDHLLVAAVKREFAAARTPFLAFDVHRLLNNYRLLGSRLQGAEVFYPVKCNDHRHILELLNDWGAGFEAASWGEVETLLAIGVRPEKIIFGATVKDGDHIARAYREGIDIYAYDSREEIAKMAAAAPGCRVYLRLAVPDYGASVFPLSGKFGAQPEEAVALLRAAGKAGLQPVGLSFHVGSQCLDPSTWWLAVAIAAWVWNRAKAAGMNLSLLNLGGGIPISYAHPVLEKEIFLSNLNLAVRGHFHRRPRLIIEPGRSLVGDVAVMVASVIGKARRGDREWLYLDAGTYQGLVEAVQERERFSYLVYAEGRAPMRRYCLGGPTCDAGDVVAWDVVLPELQCGDRVYIMNAGAYSNVCSTTFNGFPPPEVYFLSSEG